MQLPEYHFCFSVWLNLYSLLMWLWIWWSGINCIHNQSWFFTFLGLFCFMERENGWSRLVYLLSTTAPYLACLQFTLTLPSEHICNIWTQLTLFQFWRHYFWRVCGLSRHLWHVMFTFRQRSLLPPFESAEVRALAESLCR